jgi:hypothetical protein
MEQERISRRDAIKKAVYVAPLILTLTAKPAFAASGSQQGGGSSNSSRRGGSDNDGLYWIEYLFPWNW